MRAMKDSGIEWIGEIPEKWEVLRLKTICQNITDGSHFSPEIQPIGKHYITVSDVYDNKVHYETAKFINNDDFDSLVKNGCQPLIGDILLSKDGSVGRTAIVNSTNDYVVLSSLAIISPSENLCNKKFLKYSLDSEVCQEQMRLAMAGSALRRITLKKIVNLITTVPSLPEQAAIANYLDKKCAAIDTVIEKEQQVIEKLTEYKQSVITEAVTKGLNPDVPMKDSGIEWIGEIPKHWIITRLKNEADNLDYLREPISADKRENKLGLYDYYGASGVIDKIDYFNVDDDVLLIGEDGANLMMRNLPLIYKASGKFWVNNHAHILKIKEENDINYYAYLLETGDYTNQITGSAQPKLSQNNLMAYKIIKPPYIEQTAIANYLDQKCASIDNLIAKKQQLIDKLTGYKKSLIYEMVTGKKEVPLC